MRTKTPMVNHIAITKARINLGALVKRAHLKGEYFILEKDGIPIAGIMGADELEDYLEMQNPQVQRAIAESNEDIKGGRTRPAEVLFGNGKKETVQKKRAAKQKRA